VQEGRPVITDTQPEVIADLPEKRSHRTRLIAIGLVLALLVGGAAAKALWPDGETDYLAGTTPVTAEGMAAQYGINVTLIGVTAAGGLIDFRYQVVDPVKADPMVHDLELLPKLIVEDSGAALTFSSLPHKHSDELELGGSYFFLMGNSNNAIRPGSLVSVVIGEYRLEHLVAQG
jgi:hypothetical protein